MSPLQKKVIALAFSVLSTSFGYSQHSSHALDHYEKGESFLEKDPKKSFLFFEKAIQQSILEKNDSLRIRTLNKLVSLVPSLETERIFLIFKWVKQSFRSVKVPENSGLSDLHFNCGLFYRHFSNERDSALYHYSKAREMRSKILGEWHESVAQCYQQMGDIDKYYKGEFLEAEKYYEKALEIREHNKFDKIDILAENYYSLAATNRSQRDFEKAVSYGIRTVELAKQINDLGFLERTYTMLANIYRDLGEPAVAKDYYSKAIELNLKTKNSKNVLAWHYLCMGETLKNESLYAEAIASLSKSRSIYEQIEEKNPLLYVYCLHQMAETYLLYTDHKNSLLTYNALLRTLAKLKILEGRQAAEVYTGLGNYYSNIQQMDTSLAYYQRALRSAAKSFHPASDEDPKENAIGQHYYIYGVLGKKAQLFLKFFHATGDYTYLQKSLKSLILSEKLMQAERHTLDMEDAKWKFMDANYDVYEQIISTVYDMAKINPSDSLLELAFHYLEQSKARTLADALEEAERSGNIDKSDSLFIKQDFLKKEVFRVQNNLSKQEDHLTSQQDVSRLRGEMVGLDRDVQHNKLAIEEKYPGYFKVKYSENSQSVKDIQRILGRKNQVIIEYFAGNESVFGLCISKDRILFKRLTSSDSLTRLIQPFIQHFREGQATLNKNAFQSYAVHGYGLYQMLFKPFEELCYEDARVVIVPDGLLGQIPFEALLSRPSTTSEINYRALHYLLKSYPIGYAYSAASLLNITPKRNSSPSVLAMAFSDSLGNSKLQRIRGAKEELQMLSNRLNTGRFLMGNDASEGNFKNFAPSHDIIHLAVHGQGNADRNNSSSLYFPSLNDSLEDSELHSYELYGLKLKARLVVLSACESGLGKAYKGEGMISMASAFAYSGCENVLMSLWKVSDKASIILMSSFYDALLRGEQMSEALTQAKVQYIEAADELSADPKIWAPLVAYGNLDGVFNENKSRNYMIMVIAGIALILLLFYFRKDKVRS